MKGVFPLQPDTWATMLRTLFSIFKSKGTQFKHTRDFNNDGELHAVLMKQWEKEIQNDDTFATGVHTSLPDLEADRKICLNTPLMGWGGGTPWGVGAPHPFDGVG